jgi:hypothetical protein
LAAVLQRVEREERLLCDMIAVRRGDTDDAALLSWFDRDWP